MALSYVGSNTGSGEGTTHTVDLSGLGLQENDLVIVANASVSSGDIDCGVTSAGWTEITELFSNDNSDCNLSVNYKVMSATPDTSVTCKASQSAGRGSVSIAYVLRGQDLSTYADATITTATGINAAIPNAPSITTVTDNAWVVAIGAGTVKDTAVTAPSGYSNQASVASNAVTSITLAIASKTVSTAGAEDPAAWTGWTTGDTNQSWAAATMAIRPAADAGGQPIGIRGSHTPHQAQGRVGSLRGGRW